MNKFLFIILLFLSYSSIGQTITVGTPNTEYTSSTGVTIQDTSILNFGKFYYSTGTATFSRNYLKDKITYIKDYYHSSGSYAYPMNISDTMNVNLHVNKWKDSGRGSVTANTTASTSTKGTEVYLFVDSFTTDSTLQVANSYNNNAFFYMNSSSYNRQYRVDVENANVFGWTNIFFIWPTLNNVKADLHCHKLNQYLPYSIVGGDEHKGAICNLSGTWTNSNVTITVDQADIMDDGLLINPTLVNSIIKIRVINCKRYNVNRYPLTQSLIQIGATTDANSQIIIEGDFYTEKKGVVTVNTNANVLLRGSFVTASTAEAAVILGISATNCKIQGLLKTGFTESISAASARSVSILAGSSANKGVGGNVTQVGGSLTVNAGY